jgi:hypothetical protein
MTRNPINKYNLRSNSEQTNNPSSSQEGAHWNDDIDDDDDADNIEFQTNIDDDIDNDDDANISANMTEANTPKPFDPDLEHLIITILDGTKDDEVGQALTAISFYSTQMTRNTCPTKMEMKNENYLFSPRRNSNMQFSIING